MMGEDRFGPYRLLRRIAFGGMAEIFLAVIDRDAGFQKQVVVKRILPQFSADASFVQMFIDEAVVAGRLSHPNIAQTYDFGQVDGVYFMALEYIDGADLRQVTRAASEQRRQLTFAEVSAIGEGVANGLAYAHAFSDDKLGPLHIVHRDISPHNIMVSRAGDVKVMDFGIAKAAARATKTATGLLKGKLAYMAPEQAGGTLIDGRCDQFALGIVLWECLTGQRLYQGGSDLKMLQRVLAGDVPAAKQVRADIPSDLNAVVMRCLSAVPDNRYPDMRDVADALAHFRFSLGAQGVVHLDTLVEVLVPKPELSPPKRTLVIEAPLVDAEANAAAKDDFPATAVEPSVSTTMVTQLTPVPRFVESAPAASFEPARSSSVVIAPETASHRGISPSRVGLVVGVVAAVVGVAAFVVIGRARSVQPTIEPASVVQVVPQAAVTPPRPTAVVVPAAAVPTAEEPLQIAPTTISPVSTRATPNDEDAGTISERRPFRSPQPKHGEATAVSQGALGRLTLRSVGPWVEVYLGKRRLGATPLDRFVMPAGSYHLHLVNAGAGIDMFVEVSVQANEETVQSVSTSK